MKSPQWLSARHNLSLPVFDAARFTVVDGINIGLALADASDQMLDDIYSLAPHSSRHNLLLSPTRSPSEFVLDPGTDFGNPGHIVHLDSALTFMCPLGSSLIVLVFVEVEPGTQTIANCCFLPLSPIQPGRNYALVEVDHSSVANRLKELACVTFVRGTRITMANGLQKPIEELSVGDHLMTRDNGPQSISWIGQKTERTMGGSAPILIAKGALNNTRDLIVSPNHRLHVRQRPDQMDDPLADNMVPAKSLLNSSTVVQYDGGFLEYFQILFDDHEVVYAEGIAAESLVFDTRIRHLIAAEGQGQYQAVEAGQPQMTNHADHETSGSLIDMSSAARDLQRKAAG